ncbi:regulatory Fis family protein [Effusibacillus lacus]|nr:regulatory Fis family protein [Effusibacillus lacus]
MEGAFTGAKKGDNPGKFEIANGGTLFLDEIGEMLLELQASLLRVLQEREVVRIGGSKPIPIDVRIIAATNKNPNDEIAYNGSFRSDLYYRLNVFTIELIPLRERTEDIPELTSYFIEQLNATGGFSSKTITKEALELLVKYSWPGNVRELKNMLERSYYLAGHSHMITADPLPAHVWSDSGSIIKKAAFSTNTLMDIKKMSDQIEKQELTEPLVQYRGNISKTAEKLGISRTTLYRKLREYQLK